MSFRSPAMLLALFVVPALAGAYVIWQRRAAEQRARLTDLGLRAVGPATRLGWRRHLAPVVLLAGVAVLLFALAQPEVVLALPKRTGTVIVAVDVSNSMAAKDVTPTRLDAARNGAAALIKALPSSVEVGVVAFGDGAQIVAKPGDDRAAAIEAIERLAVSGGTSTGAGMYSALEAIVGKPLNLVDATTGESTGSGSGTTTPQLDAADVDIGYFGASEIVMFSDGENTSGIDPTEIADLLAKAGVKVTTVAVGTEAGAVIDIEGYSVATALDSTQLQEIAAATNGDFHEAANAEAFDRIASGLELEWRTEGKPTEVTGLFAAIAAGLLLVSAGLAAVLLGARDLMSFTWPIMLIGLIAAPLVIGVHVWLMRRRRRSAVVVSDAALIRAAAPRSSMVRRHAPVVLLALAIALAVVAAARPTRTVTVPRSQSSILLALDASASMCNTDIEPNRLTAAQEAATKFVDGLDSGARVGLVTFNGVAGLVVPSTDETDEVAAAIESITVARGTAIGSAILVAINAIAEINPDVAPTNVELGYGLETDDGGNASGPDGGGSGAPPPAGGYQPDIIVVLTDGANSRGVDPVVAAEEAAARGLRVYTIGFGSTDPSTLSCAREQLGSSVFEGGGFGGGPGGGFGGGPIRGPNGRNLLEIDEQTLAAVAESTGGEYFRAERADALADVFAELPSRVASTTEEQEISVWFALIAAALAIAATSLALLWNRMS